MATKEKEKFNPEAAAFFRLRMIYGQWYIFLFDEAKNKLGALGPWPFAEAKAEAERLEQTVKDWDKSDG